MRNDDIRAQLRQERLVEQVGRERSLEETDRRANWIDDRDDNELEWSCTREKTKREAKEAME